MFRPTPEPVSYAFSLTSRSVCCLGHCSLASIKAFRDLQTIPGNLCISFTASWGVSHQTNGAAVLPCAVHFQNVCYSKWQLALPPFSFFSPSLSYIPGAAFLPVISQQLNRNPLSSLLRVSAKRGCSCKSRLFQTLNADMHHTIITATHNILFTTPAVEIWGHTKALQDGPS
jgi:hypothetical protein